LFGKQPPTPRPGVISAKDAAGRLAADPAPFLLDVREESEYRNARIRGATLIPLNQLQRRAAEIPTDREIIVVCRSGARSQMATDALRKAGVNALNLDGGLSAWIKEKLPVERG
jgi:rhodanese-related sulfurtransferase